MITLHQMFPVWGLPNPSPACMKLETWLRMANIPYVKAGFDLSAAPKRKVPYIEDDGLRLGDSSFIIEHLERKYGIDLDAGLTPLEKAHAHALRRMLEEHFYWVIVYLRWVPDGSWARVRQAYVDQLPAVLTVEQRLDALDKLRPSMLAALDAQGTGRHSFDEVIHLGRADLISVRDCLGSKPFIMGDRATNLDATVFAWVANCLWNDIENPLRAWAQQQDTLVAYCTRMRAAYFVDT